MANKVVGDKAGKGKHKSVGTTRPDKKNFIPRRGKNRPRPERERKPAAKPEEQYIREAAAGIPKDITPENKAHRQVLLPPKRNQDIRREVKFPPIPDGTYQLRCAYIRDGRGCQVAWQIVYCLHGVPAKEVASYQFFTAPGNEAIRPCSVATFQRVVGDRQLCLTKDSAMKAGVPGWQWEILSQILPTSEEVVATIKRWWKTSPECGVILAAERMKENGVDWRRKLNR